MTEAYLPLLQSDPHHYGGIVVGPNLQPAINDDYEDSDNSSLSKESWATASETSLPAPLVRQQPLGYADTETPGQRAPSRHGRGDQPIEQGRVTCGECCKCCKSWDDWCLFLSCNCSFSFPLPMHERKCLRAARTEGWQLLWSFLLPLALGSVPLQLIWVIAQVAVAGCFLLLMFVNISYGDVPSFYISLTCSVVWLFLSIVDTVICIAISRFHIKTLVTKFSVYIIILRICYSFLCLLPQILQNNSIYSDGQLYIYIF